MENRGQKRAEIVDELPADKRACSSLESRPSTSNSSVRTHMNSTNTATPKVHEGDMETSPSTSASGRSDGEGDKDSAYGSCDSDEMDDDKERNSLREFQEQRAFGDHGKFRRVILSLNDEVEPSSQLVALTELCELLSFSTQNSLSSTTVDSLSPTLVKLVKHETSPDIMLYAVRAITYLCDVYPRSSSFLVRYEAIPALCEKLMVIEYLDVAEQCLQALEKISRDQPLVCLQAGAVMAVLNYIDFFSTSVKKVALSTVTNICKRIPSECPPLFMEAVPILSNLLQYEDRQLVESAANCFINVVERVNQSPEVLDGLCNYGLIQQAAHLVNMNSQITLSQPIYTGLLGLLVKLASGSITAVRTLFELKISSILKDILSSYDVSFGMPSPHVVDGRHNQVCEVLKLLNGLLPLLSTDQDVQLPSLKKSFLEDRPDLLLKFGMDIMPMLVQVVNAGANIHICYGCLSVINKLVYFSKPDMLYKLLEGTNISSFLAGVFTRKDGHVLNLALQIAEALLQKLSDKYLNSFIKEGVLFAVDALLMPEKCLQSRLSAISGVKVSFDSGHKSGVKDLRNCLCYAFDAGPHPSASTIDNCKLDKESFYNLAKHIRTNYFASESGDFENGWTDIFQKLRTLSSALTDVVNLSMNNASGHHDEEFYNILHQIMVKLVGEEPISTFEFIESGIVKSLINYLSNGLYLREKLELHAVHNNIQIIEKRYWLFFRVFLSMPQASKDLPLLSLIHRLQNALSLVENFPITMNHSYKQRNSYATVPNGCRITHPCVKVHFLRGEGETCLCDYYSEDVLTVDPLSSFDAIETFLRPKVITRHKNSANRAIGQANLRPSQFPADAHSPRGKVPDHMEVDTSISTEMQEDQEIMSHVPPEGASIIRQAIAGETPSPEETSGAFAEEAMQGSLETDSSSMDTEDSASCSNENASPKLLFYLEGKLVDSTLTLYQAILQQQAKDVDEFISNAKLWSQVYKVTYRKTEESIQNQPQQCPQESQNLCVSEKIEKCWPFAAFNPSLFVSELVSNLEKASPTYDVLFLLRNLEGMNRFLLQLMYRERLNAFAEGKVENLDSLRVGAPGVSQNEFVNGKLTEKIEQQMRDPLSISVGGMPLWCNQLMTSSPFLFGFEAKCKFFRLAAFGSLIVRPNQSSQINSGSPNDRPPNTGSLPRKKFSVCRDRILDSAAQMMDLHAHEKAILEVVYSEEVGTGLGPTLEFYTLVSDEFQKTGMGMWREDHCSSISWNSSQAEDSRVVTPFGLFPRPWSSTVTTSTGVQFSEVIKKFVLLGQVVAKALQDGRVMDLPLSKAFYKLILGQELGLYDIQSFDPELYRTLLEFQALVDRKSFLESDFQDNKIHKIDLCFHNTRIEDLSLEFVLPGYPDYILTSGAEYGMVDMDSLREYVSLIVDATVNAGISRQVEAFRSGFNQVFPIKHLQIFTEEELERLLCGECDSWAFNELLDHIKFDHGYTASSPPIVNLLEIMQEFGTEQRRAFLQFVTGAPRLPPGGLSSLSPKLTVVRKHCSKWADADLPSVMTCANYLKLPAYSSKDMMKERLLYAITEGQGAFHLS